MTPWIENLKVGDKVKMMGPRGRCEYKGNGSFLIADENKHQNLKKY